MNMLCKIGVHRPLRNYSYNFTDQVSGLPVYDAECPCGKKWMTDGHMWWGFKVEKQSHNKRIQPTPNDGAADA